MNPSGEFADLVGPQLRPWLEQMQRLGGCAAPVYLIGHRITRDRTSGEILDVFDSASQPYGRYAVGCQNRRESVCLSCSYLHHGDTYQVVVAGLAGGKGVPAQVGGHPRVFVTLTAPSFGPVHRATNRDDPCDRCRPRRGANTCRHGVSESCTERHTAGDRLVGVPLCAQCYDYQGAVLWNASLGVLWDRFVGRVRRELARSQGIAVRVFPEVCRVNFCKVTEYQHRGSIHVHAVIRCDGPGGPDGDAPMWASAALLARAVQAAGPAVRVRIAEPVGGGERVLAFGEQLDVQEIHPGTSLDGVSDQAVAAYIAKYVTKGDLPGLVLAHRLGSPGEIERSTVLTEHGKELMRTAWRLGGLRRYERLRLRLWAHQLGFRGQIATKSRTYSTTYTALRAARRAYHRREWFDPETTETESSWRFAGAGHSPGQSALALGIALKVRDTREARRRDAG